MQIIFNDAYDFWSLVSIGFVKFTSEAINEDCSFIKQVRALYPGSQKNLKNFLEDNFCYCNNSPAFWPASFIRYIHQLLVTN